MGILDNIKNPFRQSGGSGESQNRDIAKFAERLVQTFGGNPATPEVKSLITSESYLSAGRMTQWLSVVACYSAIRVRCESVSNTAMLIRDQESGDVIEKSSHYPSLVALRERLFEIEFELLTSGVARIFVNKVAGGIEFHLVPHSEFNKPDQFDGRVARVVPGVATNRRTNLIGTWIQGSSGLGGDQIELTSLNTIEIKNKMPISPLAASLRDIVTLRDMQDANSASFKHAYMGSHLIFALKGATDKGLEKFSTNFKEKHSGVKGLGRPPVISADSVDIKSTRPSNVDLQFIEGQKFEIEQIARGFGVPVIILQNIEASTYNNNIEARKDFYKTTVSNEWNHIATELKAGLGRIFGFPSQWEIEFDDTIIKALEPSFYDRAEAVLKLVSSGSMTINEVRSAMGFAEYPGTIGNAPLVLNTLYTLDAAEGERYPTGPATDEEGDDTSETDDDATDDDEQSQSISQERGVVKKTDLAFAIEYAQRYNARTQTFYGDIMEMLKPVRQKFIAEVRRGLSERVKADVQQAPISKANFIESEYFKERGDDISQTNIKDFMATRSQAASRRFKIPVFKDSDVIFDAYSQERAALWSQALGNKLGEALPRAFAEEVSKGGQSNPQLVRAMLDRFNNLSRVEARRIVRTETNAAANYAHVRTYEAANVESKMWISALDDRTRPGHIDANGDVQKLEDPFIVDGEELEAPTVAQGGGPASPGNSINCRCTVGPIFKRR